MNRLAAALLAKTTPCGYNWKAEVVTHVIEFFNQLDKNAPMCALALIDSRYDP